MADDYTEVYENTAIMADVPPRLKPKTGYRCPECGAAEFYLHEDGCALERCSLCDGLWQQCSCEIEGVPIPYIREVATCNRCGMIDPTRFHVPDHEWQYYVPGYLRGVILCRGCYEIIKRCRYIDVP